MPMCSRCGWCIGRPSLRYSNAQWLFHPMPPRQICLSSPLLPARPHLRPGFSLIELLIVILIITILSGGVIAVIVKTRATASSVSCISNLRQLYMAFQSYASDNGARLPAPSAAQLSWEKALWNQYQDRKLLLCPSDHEIGPAVGSSYDWRDTGDASTTLAGQVLVAARADAI